MMNKFFLGESWQKYVFSTPITYRIVISDTIMCCVLKMKSLATIQVIGKESEFEKSRISTTSLFVHYLIAHLILKMFCVECVNAGTLELFPQNFPISGEASELPSRTSRKSDSVPWQFISMVMKDILI